MRILCVTPYLAYPPEHGGRIRSFHLLAGLARHHELVNVTGLETSDDASAVEAWRAHGVKVHGAPLHPRFGRLGWRHRLAKARCLVRGRSSLIGRFQDHALARKIAEEAARRPDVVVLEHVWMAGYLRQLGDLPLVFATQNVESVVLRRRSGIEERPIGSALARLESSLVARAERGLLRRSRMTVAASREDAAELARLEPRAAVDIVPNGVDLSQRPWLPPMKEPAPRLLFIGSYAYAPNVDAARRAALEILPAVRGRWPAARLVLAGSDPEGALRDLAGRPGLEIPGRVADLAATFQAATAVIVPLRYGGGSRLKVLDAWAYGRPVVSSRIGVEGLEAQDGDNVLLAEDATDVVAALARLEREPGLGERLTRAGREQVERHHAWDRLADRFRELVEAAARRDLPTDPPVSSRTPSASSSP